MNFLITIYHGIINNWVTALATPHFILKLIAATALFCVALFTEVIGGAYTKKIPPHPHCQI